MSTEIREETTGKAPKKGSVKKAKAKKDRSGRALRRFNRWLTFLIFLGAAGFAAYTGWVQYDIPEGYGGLIHTKFTFREGKRTGGFDPELTVHDGLHWRWEKLIPTNLTMHLYPLEIRTATLSSSGTLPSGDLYMNYLDESTPISFDWNIKVSLTYRLREDAVPRLAGEKGILPRDLEDFLIGEEEQIKNEIYPALADYTPDKDPASALESLREDLNRRHPYLEITTLAPVNLILPDVEFYEKARDLYFAYLDERNRALEEMISRVAPRTTVNEEKMKVLEEYGKVLTEYPVLIDFFALDGNNDFGRYTPADLMPEDLEGSE
ncbi:MAG: hypothetical protein JXA95_16335 [Spirochaetales bacterium]|nr:hypothetical protein [Spirochaetales bacterium]